MDVLGAMCIKDDGNLCREEKDQSVSTGLGNIFRHPFIVFALFLLKIFSSFKLLSII